VIYLVWNMALFPLYKLGLWSKASFFQAWGETMGWLVRNWTVAEGQALFERLTDERIMPNLRADMLARLREHQAQGHLVALVSGTFAPWLAAVARRLGPLQAIGTPLEIRSGRYTGRIVPPLCQGDGKPERARAYLAEYQLEVDWSASYAYGDRDTDVPFLQLVGHPIAVYPDKELLAYAQAQGWPVIGLEDPCNDSKG
jgi:HAD superfamily hydrolase (TIGR01490 family)